MGSSEHTELLRWWHRYQARALIRESDFVRNGLLQEIIAIRRRIEVSCPLAPEGEESVCQSHLADLSRLYDLLENFCDRLESRYLQDSLPLALQHVAHAKQSRLNLQTDFPKNWTDEPIEQARLLTLLIKTVLATLSQATVLPKTSTLQMHEGNNQKTLKFHAEFASTPSPLLIGQMNQDIPPFLRTFQLFTQATYQYQFESDLLFLELGWCDPA